MTETNTTRFITVPRTAEHGGYEDGVTTGITCGAIFGLTPERISSFASALGGDSGGPAFIGGTTKIVGMTRGAAEFINFGAVLSEINAQSNPVGKGFLVTNN